MEGLNVNWAGWAGRAPIPHSVLTRETNRDYLPILTNLPRQYNITKQGVKNATT